MTRERFRETSRAAAEIENRVDVLLSYRRGDDVHPKLEDRGPVVTAAIVNTRYVSAIVVQRGGPRLVRLVYYSTSIVQQARPN